MKIPSQIMDTGGDVYNWGGRVLLFPSEVPGVACGILKTLWKKKLYYIKSDNFFAVQIISCF